MKKLLLLTFVCIAMKAQAVKGIASHYAKRFNGRKTATGEIYRSYKMTAASNHFKLNSLVRVINILNGKEVVVKINDRMAKSMSRKGRIVDLSHAAAQALGFQNKLIKVNVNYERS